MRSPLFAIIVLTCLASAVVGSPIDELAKIDGDQVTDIELKKSDGSIRILFVSKTLTSKSDNIDRSSVPAYRNDSFDTTDCENPIEPSEIRQDKNAIEAMAVSDITESGKIDEPRESPEEEPIDNQPSDETVDRTEGLGIPSEPHLLELPEETPETEIEPLEIDEAIGRMQIDSSGEAEVNQWLESFERLEPSDADHPAAVDQTESIEESPEDTTTFDLPEGFPVPQINQEMEVMAIEEDAEEESSEEAEMEQPEETEAIEVPSLEESTDIETPEEAEAVEATEEAAETEIPEEAEAVEATEEAAETEIPEEVEAETMAEEPADESTEESTDESDEEIDEVDEVEEFIEEIKPDGNSIEEDEIKDTEPPKNILAQDEAEAATITEDPADIEEENADTDEEDEVDAEDVDEDDAVEEVDVEGARNILPVRQSLKGAAGQIRWRFQQMRSRGGIFGQ